MIKVSRKRLGAELTICVKARSFSRTHSDLALFAQVELLIGNDDSFKSYTIINPKDASKCYCYGEAAIGGEIVHFNAQSFIDDDGIETILLLHSTKTAKRNQQLAFYMFGELTDEDPTIATLKRCETQMPNIPTDEIDDYIRNELNKVNYQTN